MRHLTVFVMVFINAFLLILLAYFTVKYPMAKDLANDVARDQIIGPSKCLAFLPKNIFFKSRELSNPNYLLFTYHEGNVSENYALIMDDTALQGLENLGPAPQMLKIDDLTLTTEYSALYQDSLNQWCYNPMGNSMCFLSSKKYVLDKKFAQNFNYVLSYLKCFMRE